MLRDEEMARILQTFLGTVEEEDNGIVELDVRHLRHHSKGLKHDTYARCIIGRAWYSNKRRKALSVHSSRRQGRSAWLRAAHREKAA